MGIFTVLFVLCLASPKCSSGSKIASNVGADFNVLAYGAKNDPHSDSSQAFLRAWNAACHAKLGFSRVTVPADMTFLINPITFYGPCRVRKIHFEIWGTIIAPDSPKSWDGKDAGQWLAFQDVTGLDVSGFGVIDGKGAGWWNQSCRYHPELKKCTKLAPTAMRFQSCNLSSLSNIKFINSPQTHISILYCNQFKVTDVVIHSPGGSPNTDGIHIHQSQDLSITNSTIGCGDDCISIGDYISNVNITDIRCGPGHGISIGSLGRAGNVVKVEKIHVSGGFLSGTTNGARIKTWQVGRGYVRDIIFENLNFTSVQNPLIIDQNYCDVRNKCPELKTGVHISNVTYKNIFGTSSTDVAINLNCSGSVPCSQIHMESVQLASAITGKKVTANCSHAHGEEHLVIPGPCLVH